MQNAIGATFSSIVRLRWRPTKDLAVVAISWVLVVASIYTATFIIGRSVWGGMGYFAAYAVVGAALFGIGTPLYWMIVVRRRPLSDLGITRRHWVVSLLLQLVFAAFQFAGTLAQTQLPPLETLLPLLALALAIGLFEAVFWRGWVLLRLEEAFGIIPAILVGSALYALYHMGYGMPMGEMAFLFFIGVMYAVSFRLTKSILVLWPIFQPMGQLVTLIKDGLSLPTIATLGFGEALILMFVLIGLAACYEHRHVKPVGAVGLSEA